MIEVIKSVFKRKQAVKVQWHNFAMALRERAFSDYFSLRLCMSVAPEATMLSNITKMIELSEKLLKMFLAVHMQTEDVDADIVHPYGHNVEGLRKLASGYSDAFNDSDIVAFTKDLDEKWGHAFQHFRYGGLERVESSKVRVADSLKAIDKLVVHSFLKLPEQFRDHFLLMSPLSRLFFDHPFPMHSAGDNDSLRTGLLMDNAHIAELLTSTHEAISRHKALEAKFATLVREGALGQ